MENTQHNEIMLALGRLEGGQIATNQHLAQLNSKVATHEGRLNHMAVEDGKNMMVLKRWEKERDQESSLKNKWMDRGILLVVTVILNLGVILLARSGIINLEKEPQSQADIYKKQIELSAEAQKLQVQDEN